MIGLLAAAPFVSFIHLWLAAMVTTVASTALILHDALTPTQATPTWVHLAAIGNALLCLALARWATAPLPVTAQWAARQEQAVPAMPPRLARPGRLAVSAGIVLICLGGACIAWSLYRQDQADRQQAAAEVVTIRITEVIDELTARAALPDDEVVTLDVLNTKSYPVGSAHPMAVDPSGLCQLVAEPYDATPWLALALLLIVPGLGLALRGRTKRLTFQRLFREPQPVTAVFARWHDTAVHLFAGDAAEHDLPIFKLALRDWDLVPKAFLTQQPIPSPPQMFSPAVRGTLYGIPAVGQWCALTVNGVTFEPGQPLSLSHHMAPRGTGQRGEPAQERPLAGAETAALSMQDYAPPPQRLFVSRVNPIYGHLVTLAMPLALIDLFRRLPRWVSPVSVYLIVAAVSAPLLYFGWVTFLRPRVAWNGGGVTIRGSVAARPMSYGSSCATRGCVPTRTPHRRKASPRAGLKVL